MDGFMHTCTHHQSLMYSQGYQLVEDRLSQIGCGEYHYIGLFVLAAGQTEPTSDCEVNQPAAAISSSCGLLV
jgi:hypothetical protein